MKPGVQFWVPRRMPKERACLWHLGPLKLWLERRGTDWRAAVERSEPGGTAMSCSYVPVDVLPRQLPWTRFAFERGPEEFTILPGVPDRPVVVRGGEPIRLVPGERTQLFVRMPLVAHLETGPEGKRKRLASYPTRILSDTWFGDPVSGELCYALRMAAAWDASELEAGPQHIVVPVSLVNRAKNAFDFERLALGVRYLDLYAGHEHLWASPVRVTYHGRAQLSEIRYDHTAPADEPNLRLVSTAIERTKAPILRRSFWWLSKPLNLY